MSAAATPDRAAPRSLLGAIERWYLAPRPQHGMVAARIVLGATLAATYAVLLPDHADVFGPEGIAGHAFYTRVPTAPPFHPTMGEVFQILGGLRSGTLVWSLHVLLVLAALAFAAGVRTRLSGAVALLLHALFYTRNPFVYEGSWAEFVHAPVLYVVLSHAGRFASWDAWRLRRLGGAPDPDWMGPGWPLRLMQIHVACMYVAAGWSRLDKESWILGEMVRVAMSGATHSKLVLDWAPWAPLLALGTWGALALEVGAPVALWVPRLGRLWALGLIGLHVMLELLTNVGWWNAVMIAGLLCFVLPWPGVLTHGRAQPDGAIARSRAAARGVIPRSRAPSG